MATMALRTIGLAAPFLFLAPLAQAQPAWPDCPNNYPGGVAPRMATAAAGDVTDLCYHGFAIAFSQGKAGPLSSSQFLTRRRMSAAAALRQTGTVTGPMHAEMRVPEQMRVQPSDYAATSYAAGQLSPAADMADAAGQLDSMSVANMVPQTPQLHTLWAKLEQAAHMLTAQYDVIYIVSGPIYQAGATPLVAGRLAIPAGVYKAFYNPEAGWAGAYVCANTAQPSCNVVTIATLQSMTGVDVFPALSAAVKSTAAPLPGVG